jgi:hypothetical protein
MKDIYSYARDVIVYWGDGVNHRPRAGVPKQPQASRVVFSNDESDSPHLTVLWKFLSAPRRTASSFDLFCLLRAMADISISDILETALGKASTQTVAALSEELRLMLLSPWWQRIWVVQEMTVPRNVTVRYGHLQAPWEMFVMASSSPLFKAMSSNHMSLGSDCVKVLQHFARYVQDCERLRKQWLACSGAPLLDLLQAFSHRQATDARDKVFGLLGLVEKDQRRIVQPDYSRNVVEAYADTAIGIIRHTGRLSIWGGDMTRKNRIDLPSWVPDWSAVYEDSDRRRAQVELLYKAHGDWGFTMIGSASQYWSFIEDQLRQLHEDITGSGGSKRLPSMIIQALNFYYHSLSFIYATQTRAVTRFTNLLQLYSKYKHELPVTASEVLVDFRKVHFEALDVPIEPETTKAILRFCHIRLWPEISNCDVETCLGHSWKPKVESKTSPDAAVQLRLNQRELQGLVDKAELQYLAYRKLAEGYVETCGPRILRIQQLCEQLKEHCDDSEQVVAPHVWVRRLFKQSPLIYGELSPRLPVISYQGQPRVRPHLPFITGAGSSPYLPGPKTDHKVANESSDDNIPYHDDFTHLPPGVKEEHLGKMLRLKAAPRILAISSLRLGRVERVFPPRLLTWSDADSAHRDLKAWLDQAVAWASDAGALESLARTLVADVTKSRDIAAGSQAKSPIGAFRRLRISDTAVLMEWFNARSKMWRAEDRQPTSPGPPPKEPKLYKDFDEALILATEGRVLFGLQTEEEFRTFGLGPASMAVDDEVRILPGGRMPVLLRKTPRNASVAIDAVEFGIIGDCFLGVSTNDRLTVEKLGSLGCPGGDDGEEEGKDEEWKGSLPGEILSKASESWAKGFLRERIFLF